MRQGSNCRSNIERANPYWRKFGAFWGGQPVRMGLLVSNLGREESHRVAVWAVYESIGVESVATGVPCSACVGNECNFPCVTMKTNED